MDKKVFQDIVNNGFFKGAQVVKDVTQAPAYAVRAWEKNTISMKWDNTILRIAYKTDPLEDDDLLLVFSSQAEVYHEQAVEKPEGPLSPVITFTLNFSDEPWEDRKMVDVFNWSALPEEAKEDCARFIPDFSLNVLNIGTLTQEQISRFQSEFKDVILAYRAGMPVEKELAQMWAS